MYVHVIILSCDSILCVYSPITEQYIFRQTCMYMSSYYHVTVYCVYNPITEQYIFRQTCMYMSSYYHVTVITVYMFLDRHVCTCHHIIM